MDLDLIRIDVTISVCKLKVAYAVILVVKYDCRKSVLCIRELERSRVDYCRVAVVISALSSANSES